MTGIVEISMSLTYITSFPGPLDVQDKRVIEELTVQASMIPVSGASPIKTL